MSPPAVDMQRSLVYPSATARPMARESMKKQPPAGKARQRKATTRTPLRATSAPSAPTAHLLNKRLADGKALREKVSRKSHGEWWPHRRRRDPIDILIESDQGRLMELLPIRHGRMLQSPFAFYRGAAAIMAEDLATTRSSGIRVQACGDCHLLNFGAFATPERRLIFDINDFDETLPGPWEWDVKRLATSFVIAGRNNGFSATESRDAARACVRSYRDRMAECGEMRVLERCYARIEVDTLLALLEDASVRRRLKKRIAKAAARNVVEEDFPKLATMARGKARIRDNPPLIFHPPESASKAFQKRVHDTFGRYRQSLPDDRRGLLDRYELQDVAIKVVGVGSVGTWCGIILLLAGTDDPLFLQVKEARRSVLEPYVGRSPYSNRGERVVVGQRLMQAASDMFLGWTDDRAGRHFYVRQLRDMKIKPLVEIFDAALMRQYATFCGWALAWAHGRSADPALISGYLGKTARFDDAVADFAETYADQNERDHQALVAAVRAGRLEAYLER
jgi:uncharacterized protein (DUF2252 family)